MIKRIHGCLVLAYMIDEKDHTRAVILVDRGPDGDTGRYVTGIIRGDELDPTEWAWGHYYDDYQRAVKDMLDRARTGLVVSVMRPDYCEGCERTKTQVGALTHKGYCRECVDAARQRGYLHMVQ